MVNYPYMKPGTPTPYGFPATGQLQAGQQIPMQPAGSVIGGASYPAPPGYGILPEAVAPGSLVPGQLPLEQSYIENILRLNLGKVATVYMTYENNSEWNAKIFRGRVEAAGRDHIILSDPETGMRYLLLMINLDYITFDEPLNYYYPIQPGQQVPFATSR